MDEDVEWPPPEASVQSAVWRAEGHMERGEYAQAARALREVVELVTVEEREFLRGLHHLAAAGRKHQDGEPERASRQLAHARRRLRPFLPEHRDVDIAALLEVVERETRS